MSFIFKRGLSTLIPPKVASPSGIGAAKDAARMNRIVDFYTKLPKGQAPKGQYKGPFSWYANRYFIERQSAMPLVHLISVMIAIGYAQNYYFHLRHHKNNAH
ncbi:mitochondrial F1F0 ATP synthase subunit [Ascobolus immersus RN42]|uniref:Mitochondrial F1F0 ATP synthase subunit n=1 Tax=Ascobolus immersus RN42 TaxID=1160509 RepID=A0A3N4IGX1_ASCIM|nr:mitochondrial F1F0 ATP synthase subunit [Ascobolus immersus RN42]